MSKKHLVIPDTQVKPGVSLTHLSWAGQYIATKRPDVVVMIGDFADMESLSSYDVGKKSFEGRRYKRDISAAEEGMNLLMAPIRKAKNYKPRLVLTLGNHEDRITRATDAEPRLEGVLSLDDLPYKKYGWEVYPYLEVVTIDGVCYSHYFQSGLMGRPVTSANALVTKKHMSCVMGHVQGRQIAYATRADGKEITGLFVGGYYQHDEAYLRWQGNKHWRGLWMLHEVEDGSFDEMPVSLRYLKKRYG
jgi:hypothetical protein